MRLMTVSILLLTVIACANVPQFEPRTIEGANCKRGCADTAQYCRNDPGYCHSRHVQCIEACADVERLSAK